VFPAFAYLDAGVPLAIGTDSQVRIDPFEEARELETGARRERRTRYALLAAHGDLWAELNHNGCRSLGLETAGSIVIDRRHPQLAGVETVDLPLALVTAASSAVVISAPSK
jgi:formimidoylglutamate deiminase